MRTALVGCGTIAQTHGTVISGMEETALDAVCDVRLERGKNFAARFGTPETAVFEDYDEMLAARKPDVVHICTPHVLHVPMAVKAMRAGCHVFMEKPPAISREQFDLLKKTKEETGRRLGVCFQNRYNPEFRKALEVVTGGAMGKILGARAFVTWAREYAYYAESPWRGRLAEAGGGVLINQALHTLDLLLLLCGMPANVKGSLQNDHLPDEQAWGSVEVEDTLEGCLIYPDGVRAVFYATTAYGGNASPLIEILCEKGTVRIEDGALCVTKDGIRSEETFAVPACAGKDYWGSGHAACIADFYRVLRENRPYRNDLASCRLTFDTMMRLYESARGIK